SVNLHDFPTRRSSDLGLGNERFRGDYQTNDPHDKDQRKFKYDQNILPIFIDGRLPFGEFTPNSRIGLLVNAGYAPSLSAMYDKGDRKSTRLNSSHVKI